jgi:putative DNA primase/helicase
VAERKGEVVNLRKPRGRKSNSRASEENLTDLGNARRLVRLHGDGLRHVHLWNNWLVFDGRRWAIDRNGEVMRRAQQTIATMYAEASKLPEADARRALADHAQKSESERRLRALVSLASSISGMPISPEELDQDPLLLSARNGTIDLTNGELRPHRREDFITKMVPADFDPARRSHLFESFLKQVVPDPAVRAFLQRAIGYSLTGLTKEQVLFILWGSGANGKTTFMETMLSLVGEYATRTPSETFLARRNTGIPNDLARLRGARFIAAVEMEEGRQLAEVRVKELTGGDTVSARWLYGEWFDFKPAGKFWIGTNHKPVVSGTDHAIWRRLRLIPFTETIAEEACDRELPKKLQAELTGILTWAVEGCLAWQQEGLNPPGVVLLATNRYRDEQDVLGTFIDECCTTGESLWVASSDLLQAYEQWSGDHSMSQRKFAAHLRERGFTPARKEHGRRRVWEGIGLAEEGDE